VDTSASLPVHDIAIERNVKIPMRDGTLLDATVWRPKEVGAYPVLVERMPYEVERRCSRNAEYYAQRGYVFVGQNVRGVRASGGEYEFLSADAWGEKQDGYDTIEWAGVQPWSNGKVGMVDGSYSGTTQYLLAPTRPPHLKALYVREAFALDHATCFPGGAFNWAFLLGASMHQTLEDILQPRRISPEVDTACAQLEDAIKQLSVWLRRLPLKSCPPLDGLTDRSPFFDMLDHPHDGSYWWPLTVARKYAEVNVPVFHLGGWFDPFLGNTLRCFQGMRARGKTAFCRESQRLVVGPWAHGPNMIGLCHAGEMDFPGAEFDLQAQRLRWYDHWLKGVDNGVMEGPPVRVYLMGENRWLDLDAWPPSETRPTALYFHEGIGRTAGSLNNGRLDWAPPNTDERPDSLHYDPQDPVPSFLGYPDLGPRDHRPLEGRMLTYSSAPLEQDLAIVGVPKAILHGTSSAPDTDWVVRLCDVQPDGRSMSICDGILRARYRDSRERAELMLPGQVYRFELDLAATAYRFAAGHRLRVHVTSSDFPRYDRNLNTGGPFAEEAHGQVALNTVYHDAVRPSHVLLPVML